MDNTALIHDFRARQQEAAQFSTKELAGFIQAQLPELKESTVAWRISQMKKERLIFQVGRGMYSFEQKPEYHPRLSLKGKRLYNRVRQLVPGQKLCAMETDMLDEILGEEAGKHFVFLYVKKDQLEALFNAMLDFSKKVFLDPNDEVIERYVLPLDEAVILKALVTETPLTEEGDTFMPTLEGLLVNAYVNNEQYLSTTGRSLKELFRKALEKYNVNQSKLLRYAARRDKREELKAFIQTIN